MAAGSGSVEVRLVASAMTTLPVAFFLAQLPALGHLELPATIAGWFCLLIVLVVGSRIHPRVRPSGRSLLLLALSVWTLPFLVTAEDARQVVSHRVAWSLMVLAAISVTGACTNWDSTWRLILRPLRNGLVVVVLLVLAGAFLDPNSIRAWSGRLTPWRINPNALATSLAAAIPLFGYSAFRTRQTRWAALVGLATVLLLITGSRGGLLAGAFIAIPFVTQWARRPARPFVWAACLLVGGILFSDAYSAAEDRVDDFSSVSSRAGIASQYFDVIAGRPWLGLMGTTGETAQVSELVGIDSPALSGTPHPHNAYLEFAYWGGIALALPLLVVSFLAIRAAVLLWLRRHRHSDPMLVAVLAWTVVAVYAHGVTGIMMVFPTYTWAWLGVLGTILIWRPQALEFSAGTAPPSILASDQSSDRPRRALSDLARGASESPGDLAPPVEEITAQLATWAARADERAAAHLRMLEPDPAPVPDEVRGWIAGTLPGMVVATVRQALVDGPAAHPRLEAMVAEAVDRAVTTHPAADPGLHQMVTEAVARAFDARPAPDPPQLDRMVAEAVARDLGSRGAEPPALEETVAQAVLAAMEARLELGRDPRRLEHGAIVLSRQRSFVRRVDSLDRRTREIDDRVNACVPPDDDGGAGHFDLQRRQDEMSEALAGTVGVDRPDRLAAWVEEVVPAMVAESLATAVEAHSAALRTADGRAEEAWTEIEARRETILASSERALEMVGRRDTEEVADARRREVEHAARRELLEAARDQVAQSLVVLVPPIVDDAVRCAVERYDAGKQAGVMEMAGRDRADSGVLRDSLQCSFERMMEALVVREQALDERAAAHERALALEKHRLADLRDEVVGSIDEDLTVMVEDAVRAAIALQRAEMATARQEAERLWGATDVATAELREAVEELTAPPAGGDVEAVARADGRAAVGPRSVMGTAPAHANGGPGRAPDRCPGRPRFAARTRAGGRRDQWGPGQVRQEGGAALATGGAPDAEDRRQRRLRAAVVLRTLTLAADPRGNLSPAPRGSSRRRPWRWWPRR